MPDFLRKPNRLAPTAYVGAHSYFLTLCTHNRQRIFADPLLVSAVLSALRTTCATHSFTTYAYCFMPDHLHLVVQGQSSACNLSRTIQSFKSLAATHARKIGVIPLWQKGFYDHVLRTNDSLDAAVWYVFMNPVRAELVKHPEDWEFSGSFAFDRKQQAPSAPEFTPPWKTE